MKSIPTRIAALERRGAGAYPFTGRIWDCDVRRGNEDEDEASAFAALGEHPADGDILRRIVHLPHQLRVDQKPAARLGAF